MTGSGDNYTKPIYGGSDEGAWGRSESETQAKKTLRRALKGGKKKLWTEGQ